MVKTSDGVLDINMLERTEQLENIAEEKKSTIASKKKEYEELEKKKKKELEELEKKKKKEIDEFDNKKKKELDDLSKKKKELEDLEKKKVEEIEETQDLIDRSFQELMRHKRLLISEEDKKKKESRNLEEVADDAPKKPQIEAEINSRIYTSSNNIQVPTRLYDVTNKSFYNNLVELKDKALKGDITPEEERSISELRDRLENFSQSEYLGRRDDRQYVKRSLNVIKEIDTKTYIR